MWFYKRLYSNFDAIPVTPRVFLVSSHQPEDPYKISCRLLVENMYENAKSKKLDPRAFFIIYSENSPVYIWQGGSVPQGCMAPYTNEALRYIKVLQKHEKIPQKVQTIDQGAEPKQFWQLFFGDKKVPPPNELYANVVEWTHLLLDLENLKNVVKREPAVDLRRKYNNEVEEEQKMKPRLYKHPNWSESSAVPDYDDLEEDAFLVLCVRA